MNILGVWLILLQLSSSLAHTYHDVEFDQWYQPVTRRPVDVVTDVINDLGVRILQQYNAQGNVAFSPAGVGFVLAALYEGSAGRGSQQIADALGLPHDRDITRIGFRDVHRRLRTYLNADGFLGGLTLNRENTRLRPEYEDILRFYGFDLTVVEEEANETTLAPETTSAFINTDATTNQPLTEAPTTSTTQESTTSAPSTSTTEGPSGETVAPSSTTSPVEILGTTLNTANLPSRLTQATTTKTTGLTDVLTEISTTGNLETTTATVNTTPRVPETSSVAAISTTVASTEKISTSTERTTERITEGTTITTETIETTVPSKSTLPSVTTEIPAETTSATNDAGSSTLAATTRNPITEATEKTTIIATTDNLLSTSMDTTIPTTSRISDPISAVTEGTEMPSTLEVTEQTENQMTSTMEISRIDVGATEFTEESTMRSVDDPTIVASTVVSDEISTKGMDDSTIADTTDASKNDKSTVSTDSLETEDLTTETSMNEIEYTDSPDEMATKGTEGTVTTPPTKDESTNHVRKRSVRSPRGYFSSYPDEGIWMQDLGIWKPYSPGVSEASVRDSTEISFLVNGCDVSSVSASRYIAVLPFAYFPSLHAVALEFPLDDPRYNILLLMPTDRSDTHRLASDLAGKSLRLLRKQLQPTWVRATIPSFMLRGFVTLTSFLQRLGIIDVFEPRVADLSLMTPDLGVYARDVQQSIGVNIRNYMQPDRTHSRNGLFERAGPVSFTALHPFLYFIVDAETSVTLIAGRVDDPLNSRIL